MTNESVTLFVTLSLLAAVGAVVMVILFLPYLLKPGTGLYVNL